MNWTKVFVDQGFVAAVIAALLKVITFYGLVAGGCSNPVGDVCPMFAGETVIDQGR